MHRLLGAASHDALTANRGIVSLCFIHPATSLSSMTYANGYENCEFFRSPKDAYLHIICSGHTGGTPHFVCEPESDCLEWRMVNDGT